MIDIWKTGIYSSTQYSKNTRNGRSDDKVPCVCCGRPTPLPIRNPVRLFYGNIIVTQEEADKIIAEEGDGGDMGFYAVGSECLKNHPELKPYVVDARKQ